MKIFVIKKSTITLFLSVFLLILLLFLWRFSSAKMVYKDREYWEKTGEIIWEVDTDKKLIALTFDDGPSPTFTPMILDLLKKYNAKATFFVIGKQALKFPELVIREAREGHEIANHTFNHKEVTKMSEYELKVDLKKAHQTINKITGIDMNLFRPTSGYYDGLIVRVAKTLNYTVIIWTWGQDSRDWTDAEGEKIAETIIKTVKPGNIILFHDLGGNRENTIMALKILLPFLTNEGYEFVTVSKLLTNNNNNRDVIK